MRERQKVLLTGFEPFWGYSNNVSQMAVEQIIESKRNRYPFEVAGCILPTSFRRAPGVMADAIKEVEPEIVLSLGLLEDISAFRIERIGLNINHSDQPDNDGDKPANRRILPDGPLAYEVNLPFAEIAAELEKAELPMEVSYHAQTFVCNHLIYTTMHLIKTEGLPVSYGFIHLPPLPEDVREGSSSTSGMSRETMLKGLDIILQALPMEGIEANGL